MDWHSTRFDLTQELLRSRNTVFWPTYDPTHLKSDDYPVDELVMSSRAYTLDIDKSVIGLPTNLAAEQITTDLVPNKSTNAYSLNYGVLAVINTFQPLVGNICHMSDCSYGCLRASAGTTETIGVMGRGGRG